MSGMGDAVMGTGTARGEERAVLAAQQAICSPLLDNQSIKGAKAALVNVTGNKKMTMREVDAATKLIYEEAGQEVHLIFGCVVDENMDDHLKVTVIATGFNRRPIEDIEIKKEVENAKNTFKKYKWPTIDVTRKSVEETAASIIKIYEIYKNNG